MKLGYLHHGEWVDAWYDTKSTNGNFVRNKSRFRNWITIDGTAGATGISGFIAEPGRYHLYVSYACPWAHRTLIFRALKGLEDIISISVVNPFMGKDGWTFSPGDGVIPDKINNCSLLHQIYTLADKHYSGRVTVPVLWDKKLKTIVSNESSEIIRMLNSAFNKVGGNSIDLYPKYLQHEIDDINIRIYENINNGVYKAGFATTQKAYTKAVTKLFEELEQIELLLAKNRYLLGNTITEADWRLFTTLVRFDIAYVGHFKCNLKRLIEFPNMFSYVKELYQQNGVSNTVEIDHIRNHYYGSHTSINPTGIIPIGPSLDFTAPHNREFIS